MIDIANARALVETLKDYAEHPSSFTDISPTEADAAADLIAALLDERDALARDAARLREGMLHFVEYGYNREVASALAAMKGASDE